MKRRRRILTLFLIVLLSMSLPATVLANESAFGESSSSNQSAFGDENTGFGIDSTALTWGGTLKLDTRAILDNENEDSVVDSTPDLDLDLNYQNDKSEVQATLNFNDSTEDTANIEEAFMRLYYDKFDLVVGKKKVVWGTGDKLHVVDNLNGEDLTDFVNPEYLDRQIGEEMVKVDYYLDNGTLEAVYTPEFTPDKLATEGNWVTNDVKLFNQAGGILKGSGNLVLASELKDKLSPTYNEIEDGQLGLRYTTSQAGYDYGFSLYQGRMKEPSMNIEAVKSIENEVEKFKPESTLSNDDISKIEEEIDQEIDQINLHYDRVTVLGTEFSSVIAGINSRAELAYYLTEDTAGDKPTVHNNKVAWIIGGDRDLPVHNVNVNLQVKSELILNNDEIKNDNDIDYNENGDYFTNLALLKVSDKFKNETILPEVSVAYNIESDDYMLDNEVEFKLKDDTSLKVNYKLFGGADDTQFGQFADNDYLSATFEYDF
ncbi:hypothetical protein [Halanaerobaculum tunisiense]